MDPQNRVLRKTSQWVGSLPGALLFVFEICKQCCNVGAFGILLMRARRMHSLLGVVNGRKTASYGLCAAQGRRRHWAHCIRCCALVLTGRRSDLRAGFWPDCCRESRADSGAFPVVVRPQFGPEGRFPARNHYCVTLSNTLQSATETSRLARLQVAIWLEARPVEFTVSG